MFYLSHKLLERIPFKESMRRMNGCSNSAMAYSQSKWPIGLPSADRTSSKLISVEHPAMPGGSQTHGAFSGTVPAGNTVARSTWVVLHLAGRYRAAVLPEKVPLPRFWSPLEVASHYEKASMLSSLVGGLHFALRTDLEGEDDCLSFISSR